MDSTEETYVVQQAAIKVAQYHAIWRQQSVYNVLHSSNNGTISGEVSVGNLQRAFKNSIRLDWCLIRVVSQKKDSCIMYTIAKNQPVCRTCPKSTLTVVTVDFLSEICILECSKCKHEYHTWYNTEMTNAMMPI